MDNRLILPPEWAAQSMVQLTWPHAGTDWKDCLDDIDDTYVAMAEAITRYEKLLIVTPEEGRVKALLTAKLSERQMRNIVFHHCETNDTWARDHGFITLTCGDGEPVLLDFKFNGWGDKFPAELDNAINRSVFAADEVVGAYEDHNDFVLEGGSIESDGKGTVFTTTGCLLASNRNQPLDKTEIDELLRRYLRADRVMWIDHGHLDGDDTDGHIDTLVRTAPDDTLVYVGCDDKSDSHYDDLRAMEEQLKTFRTVDGKPYRLLRLPMTDPVFYDGERLPATYANYLVINGAVILPTYNQPEKDREAARVVADAYPGRDIIPVDSLTIVRQHGSIHCCTMQFPIEIKK